MSKKRGLSVDDKRRVILKIYHDLKQPFNLKEIEHYGSKLGVVQQSIKEINQSLCDDSLVCSDKIGSANFFWSFPSKVMNDKTQEKAKLEALSNQLNQGIKDYSSLKKQLEETRVQSAEREEKLDRLDRLGQEEKMLDAQLESLKMNDPEQIKVIQMQAVANFHSANRWTDNVWAVKKYLTKKRGMSGKEVDKTLGIDASFDYLVADPGLFPVRTASNSTRT